MYKYKKGDYIYCKSFATDTSYICIVRDVDYKGTFTVFAALVVSKNNQEVVLNREFKFTGYTIHKASQKQIDILNCNLLDCGYIFYNEIKQLRRRKSIGFSYFYITDEMEIAEVCEINRYVDKIRSVNMNYFMNEQQAKHQLKLINTVLNSNLF